MQLACQALGGEVKPARSREFGRAHVPRSATPTACSPACPTRPTVWMSHGDQVHDVSRRLRAAGRDRHLPDRRGEAHARWPVYGLQFHPEVTHTPHGEPILRNFLYDVCGCTRHVAAGDVRRPDRSPSMRERVGKQPRDLRPVRRRRFVGRRRRCCIKAIGPQLACIFVDNGLLRQDEAEAVTHDVPRPLQDRPARRRRPRTGSSTALAGVTDPQEKRKLHRPRVHRRASRTRPSRSRTPSSWPRARSIPT